MSRLESPDQSKNTTDFKLRDRLLYHVVVPLRRGVDEEAREQLVLPVNCRRVVMEVAYSFPLAGHHNIAFRMHIEGWVDDPISKQVHIIILLWT